MTFDFDLATERIDDGVWLIAARGEIDLFTAHDLRRAGADAIDEGARDVVADLTDVSFLDSTGLGVLIGLEKRLRPAGGRLVIVNVDATIASTFAITGLDDVLTIVATRDEALAALRRSRDGARGQSTEASAARSAGRSRRDRASSLR